MIKIEVCQRMGDWGFKIFYDPKTKSHQRIKTPKFHAKIADGKVWGCGHSVDEAIGSLINSNPEIFDIEIKYIGKKAR